MAREMLDRRIQKCKKCKGTTVHIRSVKRMTFMGFCGHLILTMLTGGLYFLFLLPALLFNKGGKWTCERCMDESVIK